MYQQAIMYRTFRGTFNYSTNLFTLVQLSCTFIRYNWTIKLIVPSMVPSVKLSSVSEILVGQLWLTANLIGGESYMDSTQGKDNSAFSRWSVRLNSLKVLFKTRLLNSWPFLHLVSHLGTNKYHTFPFMPIEILNVVLFIWCCSTAIDPKCLSRRKALLRGSLRTKAHPFWLYAGQWRPSAQYLLSHVYLSGDWFSVNFVAMIISLFLLSWVQFPSIGGIG